MGTVIEGLSIVWNSDNQDFNKSVTQINKELKATGSLGREVDKALRLDPNNIELVNKSLKITTVELDGSREKSIALNKEIERLSKLDIKELNDQLTKQQKELKDSQEQSKLLTKQLRDLGDVDVNDEEYQKLTKELKDSEDASKKTQQSINQLNKDLKQLDVTNMAKLEANALKAESEVTRLEQKQEKLNKTIKNIPEGEYTELNKEINKTSDSMDDMGQASGLASQSVGELGGAVGGTTGQVVDGAGSIVGYSTALAGLGPAGIAAGAAIGTVTVAMTYQIQKSKELRAINYELEKSYGDTSSMEDYADTVYDVGRAMDDQEMAAQAGAASIKIYGDSAKNSAEQIEQMEKVMATADATGMDYAQTAQYSNQVQMLWNTNLYETEQAMGAAIGLTQEYGAKADDLNDTLTEFGPTFASMGFSMEETFAILEAGLAMGARNTDEVANAINEMNIKIGDSAGVTDDFDTALQTVYGDANLTSEAFNEMLQNDPTGTLKSLTDATYEYALATGDTNEIVKLGGQLAGTYGEEMFAEAINMKAATAGTEEYRNMKASLNSVSETAIANAQAEFDAGLITQEQLNNTIAKYEDLNLVKILTNEAYTAELEQLKLLAEQQGFSQEQLALITEAQLLFTQAKNDNNLALILEGENLATTTEFLTTYQQQLGLTDEQLTEYTNKLNSASAANDLITGSQENLNTSITNYVTALGYGDIANQQFTITTNEASASGYGMTTTTQNLTLAQAANTAATTGQTSALSGVVQQMGFTKEQADLLAGSYVTLSSDSASAEEKTKALAEAQGILESSNKTAGAATDAMGQSIDDLNWVNSESAKIMGESATASDEQNSSIEDGNKKLDAQVESLEKANPRLERNAEKAKDAAKQQEEFAKQVGKANDEMYDLNAELDDYNNKSVAPKQVSVTETRTVNTQNASLQDTQRSVEPIFSPVTMTRSLSAQSTRQISRASTQQTQFYTPTSPATHNLSIPITINGNGGFTSTEITNIVTEVSTELRKELFRLS
jgi:hypothetical protein